MMAETQEKVTSTMMYNEAFSFSCMYMSGHTSTSIVFGSDTPCTPEIPFFHKIYQALIIFMGCTATILNGFMLFVLTRFSKNRRNTTNVLIINQTTMDFVGSVALIISFTLDIKRFVYPENEGGYFICLFFTSNILQFVALTSSIGGLAVIALERYVTIVHSVTHRKYYN